MKFWSLIVTSCLIGIISILIICSYFNNYNNSIDVELYNKMKIACLNNNGIYNIIYYKVHLSENEEVKNIRLGAIQRKLYRNYEEYEGLIYINYQIKDTEIDIGSYPCLILRVFNNGCEINDPDAIKSAKLKTIQILDKIIESQKLIKQFATQKAIEDLK